LTYFIIKKVKGRHYGYEQESYREGGTVKTRTVAYYGTLDTRAVKKIRQLRDQSGRINIAKARQIVGRPNSKSVETSYNNKQNKVYTADVKSSGSIAHPFIQGLNLPKNLSKYNLSATAFQRTHMRFSERLKALGIDPLVMPDIHIKYGHPSGLRKDRKGHYVVKVSRGFRTQFPINRKELWHNYRLALAKSFLDGLNQADAVGFHKLKHRLDSYYEESKKFNMLALYSTASMPNKIKLSLHILLSAYLPIWKRQNPSPDSFGFHTNELLKDWQAEAAFIIADIQKLGWNKIKSINDRQRKKLERKVSTRLKAWKEANTLDKISGKKRKYIREIMQTESQLKALEQLEKRQKIIAEIM